MRSVLQVLQSRRFVLTALAVSLALNLFVGALAVGVLVGDRLPLQALARIQVGRVIGGLPPARQQEIRAVIRDDILPEIRRAVAARRQLRAALATAIARPELSREELEQAFAAIRLATDQAQANVQQRLIGIIVSLSPEERHSLAAGLRRLGG